MIGGIVNIKAEDDRTSELIEQVSKILLTKMADGNPHGSGVVLSYQDHEGFFTLKSPNRGEALAQILELDKTKPFKHILLHTRYATQGEISERNSHPHLGPSGALVHNGWCPELFEAITDGWHHNQKDLQERLGEFNENGKFNSECDSEALALIFNEDPEKFADNLVGDEVFALAHLDNSGEKVTLFTQYNTVHMMYSHALDAVVFCTRKEPLEAVQEFLGEVWPIAELDSDKVYYFDGYDMTGGDFDFTTAAMKNEEHYQSRYSKYFGKGKSTGASVHYLGGDLFDQTDDDRDDLDTYFKAKDKDEDKSNNEWKRTVLEDGSVVWEHYTGEVVHCNSENEESLMRYYAELPEESEVESVKVDSDDSSKEFLDKDFEKVQEAIRQEIQDSLKDKD